MRGEPSILHLDLDAFFAAVEQRDKPSLRGKPVVVGGVGARGVVATASYEARRFGVRSAMPAHEARRRCPHAAFLAPRFAAYQECSRLVMDVLRALSPVIEPLSLDEAYVDLSAGGDRDLSVEHLVTLLTALKAEVAEVTGGVTASVGAATSKLMAKVASELGKPDGLVVVTPGTEARTLASLPVTALPGVGPVTAEKLRRVGVLLVGDLQRRDAAQDELSTILGKAHARDLVALASAQDDRPVVAQREAKSLSTEDTFANDLVDRRLLSSIVARQARAVGARLTAAGLLARTVTLKVRRPDFTTLTRATSLVEATRQPALIATLAQRLLEDVDTTDGVRLLGVGVSGLVEAAQDDLFRESEDEPDAAGGPTVLSLVGAPAEDTDAPAAALRDSFPAGWPPGAVVRHDAWGEGWVWGSGLGRVTVRFESRHTPPGPVRTLWADDPALHRG